MRAKFYAGPEKLRADYAASPAALQKLMDACIKVSTSTSAGCTAGGESGHPASPHFDDEAERYASGDLRDVYYYDDQLAYHMTRSYHP
ncbi:MAG TPA: penicillin acylase family protein [Candidatus Baltobacteraceae bacterium]|nr:penicillin acylase family protein [Candidatus Baltobacteraceae bacterium]